MTKRRYSAEDVERVIRQLECNHFEPGRFTVNIPSTGADPDCLTCQGCGKRWKVGEAL